MNDLDQYRHYGTGDPFGLIEAKMAWQEKYPDADVLLRQFFDVDFPGIYVRLRLDGYCVHLSHAQLSQLPPTHCSRGIPYWHKIDRCQWDAERPNVGAATFLETT